MNSCLSTTDITLREGLEQFYARYENQLSHTDTALPQEVHAFFKSHDLVHVLFGCDISLFGEGQVKLWTIFGTTLGFWNHLKLYRKANAFELSRKLPFWKSITDLFRLIGSVPVLILRARQMHRPWPWEEYERYLDTSIADLRKEFNIQVFP
ncbi:hypothetical protein [Croceiramulus getboli]|nr:Coq4 family protein [Flavobacteriaceae bacterium YJPT1-3]